MTTTTIRIACFLAGLLFALFAMGSGSLLVERTFYDLGIYQKPKYIAPGITAEDVRCRKEENKQCARALLSAETDCRQALVQWEPTEEPPQSCKKHLKLLGQKFDFPIPETKEQAQFMKSKIPQFHTNILERLQNQCDVDRPNHHPNLQPTSCWNLYDYSYRHSIWNHEEIKD